MNLSERLKKNKEEKAKICKMTDSEKLRYIVSLLSQDVDMLTDDSDTHGINFTEEYQDLEDSIELFLETVVNVETS